MSPKTGNKNPLIYLLAGIGIAAFAYGGWSIYQRYAAEQYQRAFFSAPATSGLPNPLGATPGPPPPP